MNSILIYRPVARVWSSLTHPPEVVVWNVYVKPVDVGSDYPASGKHYLWKYHLGPLWVPLHDRPGQVVEEKIFQDILQLGPLVIDETYTLESIDESTTKLSIGLNVSFPLPGLRWIIQKYVRWTTLDSSLSAIKTFCENN